MKNKKLLLGIAWAWLTLPVGKCGSEIARFLWRRHGDATADSCQFMGNSYSQCTGENYNKLHINKPIKRSPMQKARETCFIHPLCRRPLHDHF